MTRSGSGGRGAARRVWLALMLVLLDSRSLAAERYLRGFVGIAFGGSTTFVDLEQATGRPHPAVGAAAVWLGDLVGVEVEASRVPGFFDRGTRTLVTSSALSLISGSVVVALPRHLVEYGLRPYAVGGVGWLRIRLDDVGDVFRLRLNRAAMVVGGGATGFLTARVGLNWDVRYVRMMPTRDAEAGVSFGPPRLRFWRGSMSIAVRY